MGDVHLICGNDPSAVERRAEREAGGVREGLEILSGRMLDFGGLRPLAEELDELIRTTPMFSAERRIWLRSVTFMGATVPESHMASFDKICAALNGAKNLSVSVLLSACPIDRRLRTYVRLKSCCTKVTEIADGAAGGAEEIFAETASELGLNFDFAGRSLFMGRIGNGAHCIASELEKLSVYLGERRNVCAMDVGEVVCEVGEDNFFEPVEAFFRKDFDAFAKAAGRFFATGGEPRALLSAMQQRNRIAMQLRAAADCGKDPSVAGGAGGKRSGEAKIAADSCELSAQNHWYLRRLRECADIFSLGEHVQIQRALLELFIDLTVHWREVTAAWCSGRFIELFAILVPPNEAARFRCGTGEFR
ncbi:MAG: hypothetical protein LBI39_01555 [Puniceicoccales bacterium]|jgi:DNA polymerase III delta subunit|nr:hypothetical protein [Puniceicoccales bacterium]